VVEGAAVVGGEVVVEARTGADGGGASVPGTEGGAVPATVPSAASVATAQALARAASAQSARVTLLRPRPRCTGRAYCLTQREPG
jgi:hypothetical protein